jgi:YidC/Oxa1 family membrane protein insertase
MLPDQDSQKNLLLAIVLSVAVLLAWQVFYAGPKLKEEQERRQRIQQEQQTQAKGEPGAPPRVAPSAAPGTPAQPGATPSAMPSLPTATREAALAESPRVKIDTPSLRGSIALKGGRIDDLMLTKYKEEATPASPNVVLFSPSGAPEPYYAEYGWVATAGASTAVPGSDTLWRAEAQNALTTATPITLVWDNGQGLVFRRKISVDPDYLFTVSDEVENKTQAAVTLYPYFLISRHGTPKTQGFYILHEGPIGVLGEAGLQELAYADLLKEGGTKTFKQTGGWLGITDKYWAAALVPDQKTPYQATFSGVKGSKDRYQADFLLSGGVAIAPGARNTVTSNLFAGAKQVTIIERYQDALGARLFDRLIDWGWFWFITKPLFKLLHWLSNLFGNYGLAILATTVLVKLAFFPLANKSYESMAKMKKLQPEMEKIRDRFKDDRTRQQQELMALYKNEKINPMSGCLPILLQIPVFFALYKVLFVTIDMRQAPFFGWIKDLSAADPTSVFNLFGLLPYAVPEFLQVGAWPLIMGVTMWVQMQLNPQQPDPVQQKIFNWMPVIFTFMLATFPSGLVIYWAWNNVLSLIQQYYIMQKNGAEIHLWKNLGTDKWKARLGTLRSVDTDKVRDLMGSAAAQIRAKLPKPKPAAGSGTGATKPDGRMTRDEALSTLGLKSDATQTEIDAALDRQERRQQKGLNGSDHVIAAKLDEAREILRGKA